MAANRKTIVLGAVVIGLLSAGCDFSMGDPNVTLKNETGQEIRVDGNCVTDDPHSLGQGQTDNYLYLGADCRIDNGDGLDGILGCVTLTHQHTVLTLAKLRRITGPNDCWGSGTR